MLFSTLFCLRIELHFHIHLAYLMHHYHCSYLHLLPSFLLDHLSICHKKGESILESFVISIWLLCTFLGGKILFPMHICRERFSIGEMHISRGRRHCLNKKTLFSLFFLYVCFLVCFIVLLVNVFSFFFSTLMSLLDLVSLMLFKPKCVSCVLDMHTSFCYCASLNVCLDDHLLSYVIIVVISI